MMQFRRDLPRIALLCCVCCFPEFAAAQTDPSALFEPWEPHQLFNSETNLLIFDTGRLAGKSAQLIEGESTGRWRLDQQHEINPTIGYDATWLQISNSAHIIPEHLTDLSLGIASPLGASDNWFVAASAAVGYAGDQPFTNSDAWYGKTTIILGRQLGEHTLLFMLTYDGNRTLLPDVPIPAIEYTGQLNKNFSYVLGFPNTSATWQPIDPLTFELSWDFPISLDATARYKLTPMLSIFAAYSSRESAFHTRDLPDDRRLFFEEQLAQMGLTWRLNKFAELTAAAGFGFDRKFSQGFDDRTLHRIATLSDEPFLRFGLTISY